MGLAELGGSGKPARMKVATPLPIVLPRSGLGFAESVHAQDFRMAERADTFHKLIYVLDGEVELHGPGRALQAFGRGGVLAIPASRRHRLRDVRPATVLLMCFGDDWLRRIPELEAAWQRSAQRPVRSRRVPAGSRPRLESLWRRALFEQTRDHAYAPALTTATAIEILAELGRLERLPEQPTTPDRVKAVAREIEASFVEPWTIERAATRAGLSRRSFTAHFRSAVGTTFWDYLEALRVAHAATLLRQGEHTLLGVMFSCGFNDVSTFYRAFKRRHHTSPQSWRSRHLPEAGA